MSEEEGFTDSENVITRGRNLLSVPAPGGDGEEGAALRVGDLRGTMADSFHINQHQCGEYEYLKHFEHGCTFAPLQFNI